MYFKYFQNLLNHKQKNENQLNEEAKDEKLNED